MTYKLKYTSQFKKDYKRSKKQGREITLFVEVLEKLRKDEYLGIQFSDHQLTGNFTGFRECHLNPDWILIYRKDKKTKTITLTRIGSHSDLF